MPESSLAIQDSPPRRASTELAAYLGMNAEMMADTLRVQCFKSVKPEEVSDMQLAAFISVANLLRLNPLIPGQLYAFPEKGGGIVPIVGPDGVMKKLQELIDVNVLSGYECTVFPEDPALPPTHATCIIHRSGEGKMPAKATCYFKEWFISSNPNWNARPRHMLSIRVIKQAARQVINGLPMDNDEYTISQMENVTDSAKDESAPVEHAKRPKVERSSKGATKAMENPEKSADQSIDVSATKVEDKPVTPPAEQKPPEKPAEKPADPVPEKKPDAPKPTTDRRTTMVAGETLTFDGLEVIEFTADMFGKKPALKALVKGLFSGHVYDGAVSMKVPGDATKGFNFSEAWQIKKPVTITLMGKPRSDGSVAPMVQSISLSAQSDDGDIPS